MASGLLAGLVCHFALVPSASSEYAGSLTRLTASQNTFTHAFLSAVTGASFGYLGWTSLQYLDEIYPEWHNSTAAGFKLLDNSLQFLGRMTGEAIKRPEQALLYTISAGLGIATLYILSSNLQQLATYSIKFTALAGISLIAWNSYQGWIDAQKTKRGIAKETVIPLDPKPTSFNAGMVPNL